MKYLSKTTDSSIGGGCSGDWPVFLLGGHQQGSGKSRFERGVWLSLTMSGAGGEYQRDDEGVGSCGTVPDCVVAVSTAFRMVPTVLAGSASVVQAQKSRGLDLESGNIFARLRKHLPLLVPVFVNAIRTTDLLAMALESKGFGSKRRTEYLPLRMKQWDWVALLLALGTAAAAVAARRVFGFGMVLPRL